MKFVVTFLNLRTKRTERHHLETRTVGQALRSAIALTMGKDTRDLSIIEVSEDE